jgi:hypothetical protein
MRLHCPTKGNKHKQLPPPYTNTLEMSSQESHRNEGPSTRHIFLGRSQGRVTGQSHPYKVIKTWQLLPTTCFLFLLPHLSRNPEPVPSSSVPVGRRVFSSGIELCTPTRHPWGNVPESQCQPVSGTDTNKFNKGLLKNWS